MEPTSELESFICVATSKICDNIEWHKAELFNLMLLRSVIIFLEKFYQLKGEMKFCNIEQLFLFHFLRSANEIFIFDLFLLAMPVIIMMRMLNSSASNITAWRILSTRRSLLSIPFVGVDYEATDARRGRRHEYDAGASTIAVKITNNILGITRALHVSLFAHHSHKRRVNI